MGKTYTEEDVIARVYDANKQRGKYLAFIVKELDRSIAELEGHGFAVTPWERSGELSDRLRLAAPGGVWVKDETRYPATEAGMEEEMRQHDALIEKILKVQGDGVDITQEHVERAVEELGSDTDDD